MAVAEDGLVTTRQAIADGVAKAEANQARELAAKVDKPNAKKK